MISMAPIDRRAMLGFSAMVGVGVLLSGASTGVGKTTARFAVMHSDSDWRAKLGDARYTILRREGTEPSYSSPLLKEHRKGIYACAGCALPLFSSAAKYDSKTGWPSFWKALPKAVGYRRDRSLGMVRTEEHCRRCGGHLGHVFDDGPPPTGKRHCINGLSLVFRPA